jgi:MFS family permease
MDNQVDMELLTDNPTTWMIVYDEFGEPIWVPSEFLQRPDYGREGSADSDPPAWYALSAAAIIGAVIGALLGGGIGMLLGMEPAGFLTIALYTVPVGAIGGILLAYVVPRRRQGDGQKPSKDEKQIVKHLAVMVIILASAIALFMFTFVPLSQSQKDIKCANQGDGKFSISCMMAGY